MEIDKIYEPQRFEPHWAKLWVDEQLFHVEARKHVDGSLGGHLDVVVFSGNIEMMDGVAVEIAVDGNFCPWINFQVEREAVLTRVGTWLETNLHDTLANSG